IRILRNQKRNALNEDEFIFEEKIKLFNRLKEIARASKEDDLSIFQSIHSDFNHKTKTLEKNFKNKLNELEQANNADSVLNSNLMRMELDKKDEYIDILTKQVSELKLVNEEKNNLIKNLEDKIKKLTGDIEVFRNNFKMEMKADLHSQIELYRNRIAVLESWLGIVLVQEQKYEVTDSDTDSPHLLDDCCKF
ncbi:11525_t:CDS:2, partial [Gigaspora margarita]